MEPKGKYVLATTNQSEVKENNAGSKEDNLEAPMEEDDPNEPGDKLNELVKSELATPLQPDFEEELANIKSVPSSKISKGNTILIK